MKPARETLAAGRAGCRSSCSGPIRPMRKTMSGRRRFSRARSTRSRNGADPQCAHLHRRRKGDRERRCAGEGRQNCGGFRRQYSRSEDAQCASHRSRGQDGAAGLIDVHVHLGPSGGIDDYKDYDPVKAFERELAAYLYSGVTAVRSVGDMLDTALDVRQSVNSGEKLGAEFFMAGPLFTTAGGHGTEYVQIHRRSRSARGDGRPVPPPAAERRRGEARWVDALKKDRVDAIKAIMEAGAGGMVFNRLDPRILMAIGAAARADNLPLLVHTGSPRDVEDALKAGASGIEHGSFQEPFRTPTSRRWRGKG